MIKIVKSKTIQGFQHLIECLRDTITVLKKNEEELLKETINQKKLNDALMQENADLTKRVEALSVVEDQNENTVRLVISPDLDKVTPFIKYRPDCFENMFQNGLLGDDQADQPHAIQLALVSVAAEAMQQLLDAFSEEIEG